MAIPRLIDGPDRLVVARKRSGPRFRLTHAARIRRGLCTAITDSTATRPGWHHPWRTDTPTKGWAMETKKQVAATITLGLSLGAAAAGFYSPPEARADCSLFMENCRS